MSQNLSSAAVVIGTLRANSFHAHGELMKQLNITNSLDQERTLVLV